MLSAKVLGFLIRNPALGALAGALITAVLQNFASQTGLDGVSNVIGLIGAMPILLSDNIGMTITAPLASIGPVPKCQAAPFSP